VEAAGLPSGGQMSFLIKRPFVNGMANAIIHNGPKEISIACDDSCGVMMDYGRSDLRLYRNNKNVTHEVWPDYQPHGTIYASLENIEKAIAWLKEV
jgi:hypothetical protein